MIFKSNLFLSRIKSVNLSNFKTVESIAITLHLIYCILTNTAQLLSLTKK